MEEIPSKAISEEVSNPRPKRTPRGYIFQGLARRMLATMLKTNLETDLGR